MAFYVDNPDYPAKKNGSNELLDEADQPPKRIDSTALQVKYPNRVLDPVQITGHLKMDLWTRREALLLLAGYNPITPWEYSQTCMSSIGPWIIFFLDGTNSDQLNKGWGITHPRSTQNFESFLDLISWASHQDLSEVRPPDYWIEWARSKGFAPYWLEYVQRQNCTKNEVAQPISLEADTPDTSVLLQAESVSNVETPDFSMLATRDQLIKAFGAYTGMNKSWFYNLKDTPSLLAARKITGQGGRGHIQEPWFCPLEVMQWLANPKLRKGNPMTPETAWRMLENHFSKVYSKNSVGDPRKVN